MYFPEGVVDDAIKQIPPEWLDGDEDHFDSLLRKLLTRRKRVPDLIASLRRAGSTVPSVERRRMRSVAVTGASRIPLRKCRRLSRDWNSQFGRVGVGGFGVGTKTDPGFVRSVRSELGPECGRPLVDVAQIRGSTVRSNPADSSVSLQL